MFDNKSIFDYDIMLQKYENCRKCRQEPGLKDKQFISHRVQEESDLLGIIRLNSLCPSAKYYPCGPNNMSACNVTPTLVPTLCDRDMVNFYNLPRNFDVSYKGQFYQCGGKQ
jgi:hypothetical protein